MAAHAPWSSTIDPASCAQMSAATAAAYRRVEARCPCIASVVALGKRSYVSIPLALLGALGLVGKTYLPVASGDHGANLWPASEAPIET